MIKQYFLTFNEKFHFTKLDTKYGPNSVTVIDQSMSFYT